MQRGALSGLWNGVYSYDPESVLGELPPTGFVLKIEYEKLGHFRGTVEDDPVSGIPEVGTVDGYVSGDRVEFVKRMPDLYVFEAGRLRHIADCVREWWDLEVDGPVPGPPICYEGKLVGDSSRLDGRWWIDMTTVPIPSRGVQYALDLASASGTWYATKQG